MVAAVRRLLLYLGGFCAALALVEGAFRIFEAEISASASRVETKALLLEKQGAVDVLFFGTSRFWDGIAPRRFAAAFPGVRAFSLATSAAKLETLESETRRFAHRRGLRLAVIELSGPQLDPAEPPEPSPAGIEAAAGRYLRLVAHRSALRGESLLRLPELLLFPGRVDGSEVRFIDQLASALGLPEDPGARLDLRPAPVPSSPLEAGTRARRISAVASSLRAAGVQVVFVLPPILPCEPAEDVAAVAASLAREFAVWDYRRAALPADAWRGCSHLSRAGRIAFTRALAEEAAREGLLHAVAERRE